MSPTYRRLQITSYVEARGTAGDTAVRIRQVLWMVTTARSGPARSTSVVKETISNMALEEANYFARPGTRLRCQNRLLSIYFTIQTIGDTFSTTSSPNLHMIPHLLLCAMHAGNLD